MCGVCTENSYLAQTSWVDGFISVQAGGSSVQKRGQSIPVPNQGRVSVLSPVAMYREPSLHDVGETVPKAGVTPSKSTSASAIMNGGKPVNKSKTT